MFSAKFNKIKFNRIVVISSTPIITIVSYSTNKISDEIGKDICTVIFRASLELLSWEARASNETQTPGLGVGLLVGSGGEVIANTDISFDIIDDELTQGDRAYVVTIYVLSD